MKRLHPTSALAISIFFTHASFAPSYVFALLFLLEIPALTCQFIYFNFFKSLLKKCFFNHPNYTLILMHPSSTPWFCSMWRLHYRNVHLLTFLWKHFHLFHVHLFCFPTQTKTLLAILYFSFSLWPGGFTSCLPIDSKEMLKMLNHMDRFWIVKSKILPINLNFVFLLKRKGKNLNLNFVFLVFENRSWIIVQRHFAWGKKWWIL